MTAPSRGHRPDAMASSITLMPYMMDKGDERVLADALFKILSKPGHYPGPVLPAGAPAEVGGSWQVRIQYPCGIGEQHFTLKQNGNAVTGDQKGEIFNATVSGTVHGDLVRLHSRMPTNGYQINWTFEGNVRGNAIAGTVDMGEYGPATWSAMKV
jgi:hypothetical protein